MTETFYNTSSPYDYVISAIPKLGGGTYYCLQEGVTGHLVDSNLNQATIQSAATGLLSSSGGSIYIKNLVWIGSVASNIGVTQELNGVKTYYGHYGKLVSTQPISPYSYMVYKDPDFTTNGLYNAKAANGVITQSSTDAATVLQYAYDNAPVGTTIRAIGDIELSDTFYLNRSGNVNFTFDNITMISDVHGLFIGSTGSTIYMADSVIQGNQMLFSSSYTHSLVWLQAESRVTVKIQRMMVVGGGMAVGDSAGFHFYADGHGIYYNKIHFQEIGALGTGIKLETTSNTNGFIHPIDFYCGTIWAADIGIDVESGHSLAISTNTFHDLWLDGATKMTTSIKNNGGDDLRFINLNEVDMFGSPIRLDTSVSSTTKFWGGQLNSAYCGLTGTHGVIYAYNVKYFVTENKFGYAMSNQAWIPHGLCYTPNTIFVTGADGNPSVSVSSSEKNSTTFRVYGSAGFSYFTVECIPIPHS